MSGEQFSVEEKAKMERGKGGGWDADIISRFGGYTICYYGHTHTHTYNYTTQIDYIYHTHTDKQTHTHTHTQIHIHTRHTQMTDRQSR